MLVILLQKTAKAKKAKNAMHAYIHTINKMLSLSGTKPAIKLLILYILGKTATVSLKYVKNNTESLSLSLKIKQTKQRQQQQKIKVATGEALRVCFQPCLLISAIT